MYVHLIHLGGGVFLQPSRFPRDYGPGSGSSRSARRSRACTSCFRGAAWERGPAAGDGLCLPARCSSLQGRSTPTHSGPLSAPSAGAPGAPGPVSSSTKWGQKYPPLLPQGCRDCCRKTWGAWLEDAHHLHATPAERGGGAIHPVLVKKWVNYLE